MILPDPANHAVANRVRSLRCASPLLISDMIGAANCAIRQKARWVKTDDLRSFLPIESTPKRAISRNATYWIIHMTFTAKEDYGLRASIVLAAVWHDTDSSASKHTVQAQDIASRQQIPEPFLEQVLATLRRAGIVNATRGSAGGYELARSPETITAADILRALSGPLVPSRLVEQQECTATPEGAAICQSVWTAIEDTLTNTLEHVTLRRLLDESRASTMLDACGMNI
jgi:Rrf2 family protein